MISLAFYELETSTSIAYNHAMKQVLAVLAFSFLINSVTIFGNCQYGGS